MGTPTLEILEFQFYFLAFSCIYDFLKLGEHFLFYSWVSKGKVPSVYFSPTSNLHSSPASPYIRAAFHQFLSGVRKETPANPLTWFLLSLTLFLVT